MGERARQLRLIWISLLLFNDSVTMSLRTPRFRACRQLESVAEVGEGNPLKSEEKEKATLITRIQGLPESRHSYGILQ